MLKALLAPILTGPGRISRYNPSANLANLSEAEREVRRRSKGSPPRPVKPSVDHPRYSTAPFLSRTETEFPGSIN